MTSASHRRSPPVAAGQSLTWADVAVDTGPRAYALRREREAAFAAA
jgi:hypothetical protein